MKKVFFSLLFFLSILFGSSLDARRGSGGAFVGGLAGGMMGGVISGAMRKDSGRVSRAEQEARIAQEKAESVRREHQKGQVEMIKDEMQAQKGRSVINLMIFALFILFLLILGMFFMMLKMKKGRS
ncbi:hypothetical protein KAT08_02135 [Candidatus Babeliales bacterium]|nr:hypothetical protein [Candidatus Babeliales bacterium]